MPLHGNGGRAGHDGMGALCCPHFPVDSGFLQCSMVFYFTQRTFSAGFYPLALKKYTLFFYLRVVYA